MHELNFYSLLKPRTRVSPRNITKRQGGASSKRRRPSPGSSRSLAKGQAPGCLPDAPRALWEAVSCSLLGRRVPRGLAQPLSRAEPATPTPPTALTSGASDPTPQTTFPPLRSARIEHKTLSRYFSENKAQETHL